MKGTILEVLLASVDGICTMGSQFWILLGLGLCRLLLLGVYLGCLSLGRNYLLFGLAFANRCLGCFLLRFRGFYLVGPCGFYNMNLVIIKVLPSWQ